MAVKFAIQLWWLGVMGHVRSADRQDAARSALYTRQATEFTAIANELGGLFIKVGQYLTTRVDVMPIEYTRVLGTLHDSVPAVPGDVARGVVESELGRPVSEIFTDFDPTPLAAASIAEVHVALLPDGRKVAVKVQRPGIEELIEVDLKSLKQILGMVDRWTEMGRHVNFDALYEEMAETFLAETDFHQEGLNAERFQINFLENPHTDIPQIHWDQSARRVLTMEFMEGIKINDLDGLDAAGIDREATAKILLDAFLQMVLRDGFLHADLHPGNMLIRRDGVVQFLDFGMVARIPEDMRGDFAAFAIAFVQKDFQRCADILVTLGFLTPSADTALLAEAFEPLIATTMSGDWRSAGSLPPQLLDDLQQFILDGEFSFPSNVTFLGKGLITVLGVCMQLEPDADIVAQVRDLAGSYGDSNQLRTVLGDIKDDATAILRSALPAARAATEWVVKANAGRMQVRLDPRQERRLIAASDRSSRRISGSILAACVFGGGVTLTATAASPATGIVAMVAGGALLTCQWLRK
jgi:predicted unusual protein kinase regulating ubiquinone biosynthesis (AarF/ABC1/UbiB family)